MTTETKCVKLGEIIKEFQLEILHEGSDCADVPLHTLDVNRSILFNENTATGLIQEIS